MTRSWALDRPVDRDPFAAPRGLPGRLAGRFVLWTNRHEDMLSLLKARPGARELEAGCGPAA